MEIQQFQIAATPGGRTSLFFARVSPGCGWVMLNLLNWSCKLRSLRICTSLYGRVQTTQERQLRTLELVSYSNLTGFSRLDLDTVVNGLCLPFVLSSPRPHITINFSTTAPQHMLLTSQMSCPITFPNLALTHFTFNFPLAIFLVIHLFLLPMFSPVIPIHVPNFLRIFSSPAFPIPQANIACSIFSPI